MRVVVADWAGACSGTLERLGYRRDETNQWPIHDMSFESMTALAVELLAKGVGVMIRPPSVKAQGAAWDYILYVDSARGRFSHR